MAKPTPINSLLIVGLGNPGANYRLTRHNLGWLVIDELAKRAEAGWQKKTQLKGQLASFKTAQMMIHLLKPETFMNSSGLSVQRALAFFKIKPDSLWVIHDDLDLAWGKLRLSHNSSAGGHRGVQSIINELGSQNWWRWRLGIGPLPVHQTAEDYVLQKFSPDERKNLKSIVNLTLDQLQQFNQPPIPTTLNLIISTK